MPDRPRARRAGSAMQIEPAPAVQAIHRHLAERRGLDLSRYKETYLRRRLLVRVRALKLGGFEDYAVYLRRHPEEIGPLQRALSIKVTGFFRNRSCFASLKEHVIPELARRAAAGRHRIDVWSAGCATGEETWSLAALFASAPETQAARVRILGTDVDEGALETARTAAYPAAALLSGAPPEAVAPFTLRGDGLAVPGAALRRMVEFERESLLDPFERHDLDLVVCRNVLIYFSLEHQVTILDRFAAALSPGGYLVLGRVERLFGPARDRFEVASARDRIYRRAPQPEAAARAEKTVCA
jgi:chemotaxis methyl-accepting protein methylase